jgi:hypothetical protein
VKIKREKLLKRGKEITKERMEIYKTGIPSIRNLRCNWEEREARGGDREGSKRRIERENSNKK